MNIRNYQKYFTKETMTSPNSLSVLDELFYHCDLQFSPNDSILDLGCGKGLTSLIIAKETGAKVYATDFRISAEENRRRFTKWKIDGQVIPVHEDVKKLHFEEKQFTALFSIDFYHYLTGKIGFFEKKILPFIKDGGIALIGVPGIKEKFESHFFESFSSFFGEDADIFKSAKLWKETIGNSNRIQSVNTWEIDCFGNAWSEWFAVRSKFADGDRRFIESFIEPYTCFFGIEIKLN